MNIFGRVLKSCLVLSLVFGLGSLVFSSCSQKRTITEASNLKPASVKIRKTAISGDWGLYLKVQNGTYSFSLSDAKLLYSKAGGNYMATISTSIKLELIKTYTGDTSQLADIITLVPTSKTGIGSVELYPADMERFTDLITGTVGTVSIIKFESKPLVWTVDRGNRADANGLKAQHKLHIIPITGVEFLTSRYRPTIIAVSPVDPSGNIDSSEAENFRLKILSYLKNNPTLQKVVFVDTSKINAVMAQHKFEASDWSNNNKVAQIGEALNANVLVVGTISKEVRTTSVEVQLSTYHASAQIMNINTMEIIYAASASESLMENLFEYTGGLHLDDTPIRLP